MYLPIGVPVCIAAVPGVVITYSGAKVNHTKGLLFSSHRLFEAPPKGPSTLRHHATADWQFCHPFLSCSKIFSHFIGFERVVLVLCINTILILHFVVYYYKLFRQFSTRNQKLSIFCIVSTPVYIFFAHFPSSDALKSPSPRTGGSNAYEKRAYFFRASSTATETAAPTMGEQCAALRVKSCNLPVAGCHFTHGP